MSLAGWIGVVFGTLGFGAGIWKLVEIAYAHRLERRSKKKDADAKTIDTLTKNSNVCNARLTALEEISERRGKTDQAMLKALNAILLHLMSNNSKGEMKDAQQKLLETMIDNT